jgi:hypothetical protein
MPKFRDVHSLGNYTEGELKKKYQELPKDELGVKVFNILYNEEIGISFCFLDFSFIIIFGYIMSLAFHT